MNSFFYTIKFYLPDYIHPFMDLRILTGSIKPEVMAFYQEIFFIGLVLIIVLSWLLCRYLFFLSDAISNEVLFKDLKLIEKVLVVFFFFVVVGFQGIHPILCGGLITRPVIPSSEMDSSFFAHSNIPRNEPESENEIQSLRLNQRSDPREIVVRRSQHSLVDDSFRSVLRSRPEGFDPFAYDVEGPTKISKYVRIHHPPTLRPTKFSSFLEWEKQQKWLIILDKIHITQRIDLYFKDYLPHYRFRNPDIYPLIKYKDRNFFYLLSCHVRGVFRMIRQANLNFDFQWSKIQNLSKLHNTFRENGLPVNIQWELDKKLYYFLKHEVTQIQNIRAVLIASSTYGPHELGTSFSSDYLVESPNTLAAKSLLLKQLNHLSQYKQDYWLNVLQRSQYDSCRNKIPIDLIWVFMKKGMMDPLTLIGDYLSPPLYPVHTYNKLFVKALFPVLNIDPNLEFTPGIVERTELKKFIQKNSFDSPLGLSIQLINRLYINNGIGPFYRINFQQFQMAQPREPFSFLHPEKGLLIPTKTNKNYLGLNKYGFEPLQLSRKDSHFQNYQGFVTEVENFHKPNPNDFWW